mmetsp:Transcript_27408/g.59891  ORF Transcript_27408/g.59891 Transcript_27408/m.59891 type:complete len:347 (-) Transcript_27408:302-1342(-)|eukprot:CAMPEP_0118929448 /NCGR_PEP_ID=MMETSP1169-20130426/6448_1 /TAXON_ID=36882 /ORGANISM="Pyramimonas obovata, Strain CCMP722" /LENGTH=346 /DNA_ID=CAMNT_0006871643 /DNA_START=32 /DNA_END=1072 /DNA_ORIENTATION=-
MSLSSITSVEELDQALSRSPLVVVHFWATWCEPCKQMDVVLTQLAREQPHAAFCRVEAESHPDLAEKYEVSVVPFFVFFKNGALVDKLEGSDAPELVAKVAKHAGAAHATAPATAPLSLNQKIEALLNAHDVLLFMKGTRDEPRCGFSSRVVTSLKDTGLDFETFNILENPEIRQGLKEYSNWPTYPQLYAKATLIGGCDIIEELAAAGELKQTILDELNSKTDPAPKPTSTPAPVPAPTKESNLTARIESVIASSGVVLFMKGSPDAPRCGFSSKVVAALQETGLPFGHFDILSDEDVRQGIKAYSNWPTFPQLYVNKELVGGCDIILEMHASGELKPSIEEMLA